MVLNRALNILCERHSKAFKEVQELVSNAQKHLAEMRGSLLEETESKYTSLCEEVIEAEEEEEEERKDGGGKDTMVKLIKASNELSVPVFGEDVLDMLFSKTLIVVWTTIDPAGVNGLI